MTRFVSEIVSMTASQRMHKWVQTLYALSLHAHAAEHCFCLCDDADDIRLDVRLNMSTAQLEIRSPLVAFQSDAKLSDLLACCQRAEHRAITDTEIFPMQLRPRIAFLPKRREIFMEGIIDCEHFSSANELNQFFDAMLCVVKALRQYMQAGQPLALPLF